MNESVDLERTSPGFSIFRAADAPVLDEEMSMAEVTPAAAAGLSSLVEAGLLEGGIVKTLFSAPGFSLLYAWFKSGYPLPRHTHDADCLYFIVAGGLKLGTETLGAGDGFFVPANTPYTYRPLPGGLEILEFRHATHFNIRFLADNPAFWSRAAETVKANRERWQSEKKPTLAQ